MVDINSLDIPELWERQTGESAKAFEAFVVYRDMENRSYRGVGQELGKSKTQIEKWARKFFWQERILAFIDYMDLLKRELQIKEIEEMNERQIRVARNLQAKAAQKLQGMDLSELDAGDLVRFFITASELEREARGMSSQNVNIVMPPTIQMAWDWENRQE
jgi:hypothetical protein